MMRNLFTKYKIKSEISTRNVGRFCEKLKISIFFAGKIFYIYYSAGYLVIWPAGYPVSAKLLTGYSVKSVSGTILHLIHLILGLHRVSGIFVSLFGRISGLNFGWPETGYLVN